MNFGHSLAAEPVFEIRRNNALAEELVPRITRFYKRQPVANIEAESPLWDGIVRLHQENLVTALASGNWATIGVSMAALYDGWDLAGFEEPNAMPGFEDRWKSAFWAAVNALGVIPLFNPEQPNAGVYVLDEAFAAMESVLGFTLTHKGASGMRGALVGNRFVPLKLIRSVSLIAALMRLPNWPPARVLEIGAGCGMLATVIPFRESYHIIDLPSVAAVQAYLIGHQLGANRIWLAGEGGGPGVCIHGLAFPRDTIGPIDLVINQDSLPEMSAEAATKYFRFIEAHLKTGGFFYSVNQETSVAQQRRVFCAIQPHTSLRLTHRSPFWARDGYVEEIWTKT
jgi:hypothetical protein